MIDALMANRWHLYAFGISVTLWDALTLLMLGGLVYGGRRAWRRWRKQPFGFSLLLAAAALGSGVLVWGTWIEPARIEVVHEHADLPDWPLADPLKVALVADLHHGPNGSARRLDRMVQLINAETPDVVLIAGDLVGYAGIPDLAGLSALGRLESKLGTFAVLGNHDYHGTEPQLQELKAVLAGAGIRVLHNEVERLVPGVALLGIDSAMAGKDDVDTAFGRLLPGRFVIGLAHEPETFLPLSERRVPLVLAGHTHGGQIRLPGLGAIVPVSALTGDDVLQLPRNRQSGWFRSGESSLYITRGIGATGPRARLFCRPEITLLTIAQPASAPATP